VEGESPDEPSGIRVAQLVTARRRLALQRSIVFVCAFLILAAGCQSKTSAGRIIVLGLDGLDPETVDLLMSEGKMPNFARLRQEGAYGRLISSKPLLSPIIWTTIATGKTPDQHQIGHFVAVNEKTGEQLPVTSQMRRVKALWNILSEAGRHVDVVGWWATWPAETINGTIVSDHTCYHFLFPDGATGAADTAGLVSPATQQESLRPLIRRPGDLTAADVAPFAHVSAEDLKRPFDFNDDLSHFKWALATADTYRGIGLQLWKQDRPDVLMVYVEATDSTAHLFGHLFRARGLVGELAAQQARFGGTVEAMYQYADRIVGQYLAAMDAQTTLVVLSDHGFELGVLPDDPSKLRDMRRVSERFHRLEGILYLYGNHVKPHSRLDQPKLLDVAPTVLALTNVAPARDMSGRVLIEGLTIPEPSRSVASFEHGQQAAAGAQGDAAVDPAILEHLRSLGYLDTHSPKGDRNLAAVHFQAGRYQEAAAAYAELVQANPQDGALRASYAGALGALGRYDEAMVQLDEAIKLEPLNPEPYHNRGVIYEKRGQRDAAIREYQTALRYNPQYDASREALTRLTGSAAGGEHLSDAEKLAATLAERAASAARRGDYAEAMKQLDEAERVAPRFARVYQYRANVAFLMGDTATAKAALQKGLEIEPDNALFKANLQRLQAAPRPTP
jgi:Flp pilus assembly protein TadD/predicted AlkP superfamily pyrophosphatase or phosphodiesterase